MFVTILALSLLIPSCGYRLSGTGGLVPAGASTVAIPVFFNGTNEPALDVEVTRALVQEFLGDGRLRVVDLDAADVALRGRVTKFELSALSYTSASFVQQYRVRIVVDASLEDRKTGKVLWQESGIESSLISDYPVTYSGAGVEIRQTKIDKEKAVRKASQDLAQTLRGRVLEGF
jgi:hypothetical protein